MCAIRGGIGLCVRKGESVHATLVRLLETGNYHLFVMGKARGTRLVEDLKGDVSLTDRPFLNP